MTESDINGLSADAARDKLKAIYSSAGIVSSYFEFEDLLATTASKMGEFRSNIDLTGEDANVQFKIISDYMKNVLLWSKNQKELHAMIDESVLREAKAKRLEAKKGSLEYFINKNNTNK